MAPALRMTRSIKEKLPVFFWPLRRRFGRLSVDGHARRQRFEAAGGQVLFDLKFFVKPLIRGQVDYSNERRQTERNRVSL